MKKAFLSVLTLLGLISMAQTQYDYNNYNGIQAEGSIPYDFLTSTSTFYEEDLETKATHEDKTQRKYQEDFLLNSNFFLRDLMLSGQVSFGDPISNYLNKTKDKLFTNNLQQELRIYTVKSPLANAFATDKGAIFVTTGLVARCKTEDELAFVIAHEASHYEMNHMIEGYLENQEQLEAEGQYLKMNRVEVQKAIFERSKTKEFEADSLGKEFICNSPFDAESGVNGALTSLHRSYLPFEEVPFQTNFFEQYGCGIPTCFFLNEVKPISKEEDYSDKKHSHPNVHKRRTKVASSFESCGSPNTPAPANAELAEVVQLAKYETVRQEVLGRRYGDALYHCFLLMEDNPNSAFLELSMGKSLYGLSRYKIRRKYSLAAESSSKIEGESQQVHYMLKQFTKDQLATVTLKYLWNLQKKYPEDESIKPMIKELVKDMVLELSMTPQDYLDTDFTPSYEMTIEELDALDPRRRQKMEQKAHKAFYLHMMQDETSDTSFSNLFASYYDMQDSLKAFNGLTYYDRKAIQTKKDNQKEKNGYGIHAEKVILLNPTYGVFGKKIDESDLENEDKTNELNEIIKEQAALAGLELLPVISHEMTPDDTEKMNVLFQLKEFQDEVLLHDNYGISATSYTDHKALIEKFGTRYVCSIQVIGHYYKHMTEYRFVLYDLKTGKISYAEQHFGNKAKKMSRLDDFIEHDFKLIVK